MGNNSVLIRKPNYYWLEAREDLLAICQDAACQHKKAKLNSRATPHCMALLLSCLENWTNSKKTNGKDLGVNFDIKDWGSQIYDFFGKNTIIDSFEALVKAKLLKVERVFRAGGGKPYNVYYLEYEKVNALILALPEREPHVTLPNNNVPKGTTGTSNVPNGNIDVPNGNIDVPNGNIDVPNGSTNHTQTITQINTQTVNTNNKRERAAALVAQNKNASQSSLFSSEETDAQEQEKKPRKNTRAKKEVEIKALALPDLAQEPTSELLIQLADFYRGNALPVSDRSNSKYYRLLNEGVQPLLTRSRRGGKKGYSLQEINSVYTLLLGLNKEEWLIDETWNFPVDLWVIAKNIDNKLKLIEDLKRKHAGAAAPAKSTTKQGETTQEFSLLSGEKYKVRTDLVLWTRLEASDPRLVAYLDYTRPENVWYQDQIVIALAGDPCGWEWMSPQEALSLNNGWSDSQRFTDYQLQQLINRVYRETKIEIQHHIQQFSGGEVA